MNDLFFLKDLLTLSDTDHSIYIYIYISSLN